MSPPKNITARPTTDFAKESLFNLLNNRLDFEGIDVLDLFAGTGGIGLEFIAAKLYYFRLQAVRSQQLNRHPW